MEPLYINPLDLESEDEEIQTGGEVELKETNALMLNAIEDLRNIVFNFKRHLFKTIVSDDTIHSSSSSGALMTYHAVWLQSVAFWISLLDSKTVPKPSLSTEELNKDMDYIINAIHVIDEYKTDGHILLYALLTKISTENYPFDLGNNITETENIDSD
jgi:hypothetical protein